MSGSKSAPARKAEAKAGGRKQAEKIARPAASAVTTHAAGPKARVDVAKRAVPLVGMNPSGNPDLSDLLGAIYGKKRGVARPKVDEGRKDRLESTAEAAQRTQLEQRGMALQALIDATTPQVRSTEEIEARMRARAVEMVMNGASWMKASELFKELKRPPSNAHTVLNRWLEQGRTFALERNGVRIYPRYAFDAMVEPVPLLREVLQVLDGRSPFQIAAWFESTSSQLGGRRPREVLETDGRAVVEAAKRLVEGNVHG